MASTSRALLVAGALLASASLAHAGDRAAFAGPVPDERVDLRPIVKPEPEAAPTPAPTPVADARAPETRAPETAKPYRRHPTRLARHAAKAVAVAALKATFPAAIADTPPSAPKATQAVATAAAPLTKPAEALSGNREAAASTPPATPLPDGPREAASGTVSELVARHARENGVPVKLAEAVVRIESRGNAHAANRGAFGLMQIKYGTARAAGFSGPAIGLFAADTNLRYGMKILGDALRAAGGDTCGALMRYQSGHYATHMSSANRAYCSRARAIMAGA